VIFSITRLSTLRRRRREIIRATGQRSRMCRRWKDRQHTRLKRNAADLTIT
jgi:hypothetical protein